MAHQFEIKKRKGILHESRKKKRQTEYQEEDLKSINSMLKISFFDIEWIKIMSKIKNEV